jgi:ATP-binding cassette subfamily B multidrug efflux pump
VILFNRSSQLKKQIIDFLGPKVLKLMVFGLFAGIGVSAIELAIAYGVQAFLLALGLMKEDVVRLPQWIPKTDLISVLSLIVILAALRSIFYFFQVYFPNATYNAFGFRQRQRLIEWSFSQSTVNTPFVSTLYTERVTLSSSLVNGVQYIVIYGCTSVLVVCGLFYLSPLLSVLSLTLMAIFLWPVYLFNTRIRSESKKFSDSWEQANNRLLVGLKNIFLIRIYGAEKLEIQKSQKSLQTYSESHSLIYKLGAIKFAIPQFVGVLIICLTVYIGKYHFSVEPGILISFLYLFFRWVQNLSFIYLNAGQVIHYRPQIDELFNWYKNHYLVSFNQDGFQEESLASRLKFNSPLGWQAINLSFSYNNESRNILKDLTFEIKPKDIVLIKGPSGSGKTTLIGLLLAQLSSNSSLRVYQDGVGSLTMEEAAPYLKNSIGYAGPEPFIIDGTIRDNLLYANHLDITDSEISEALSIADCDFIKTLPKTFDFKITEQGQGLSTGQKQRLSLARAILRRPQALIMDEALSNIDQGTRDRVLKNLIAYKSRCTLIFISHFEFDLLKPDLEISFTESEIVTVQ